MPQIEEAQFVNWGSMRPDIIPLAVPGITIAVGPNGSGKTCWLDGLKVILGVADFSQRRTPASYIFNGGPSNIPADQAWLRATFANPVQHGQRHRVFAVAGNGCEDAAHVTVICRVQGDKRKYLVLPGRITWGRERPIDADLDDLVRIPDNRWLGPQKYDYLLDRAGVSKALRGVLSLPQGETDRLVTETRSGLMRRLLELTGRQGTLDEFRVARAKYGEARTLHKEARQLFEQKKLGLAQLQSKLRQYREWEVLRKKLYAIDGFLLPAARHFAAAEELETATGHFSRKQQEVATLKIAVAEDRKVADARKAEIADLEHEHEELGRQENHLSTVATTAAVQLGKAGEQARQAWRTFDAAWAAVGSASQEEVMAAVESAETALSKCLRARHAAETEMATLQEDLERLLVGGSAAPADVRAFHGQLRAAGIKAIILGDALSGTTDDTTGSAHAQAALGDALWAVVVPPAHYQHARELAVATGYPWPVAPAGPGSPSGVLKIGRNDDGLGVLLTALDAIPASGSSEAASLVEAGADATTPDGMRHGRFLSRMTPVRDHVLHPAARELELSRTRKVMEESRSIVEQSGAEAASLRERLADAYRLLDAVRRLQEKRQAFRAACQVLAGARTTYRSATQDHASASAQAKALFGRLETVKVEASILARRATGTEERLRDAEKELGTLVSRRTAAELAAQAAPLPPGFTEADITRLEPPSMLEVRSAMLTAEVNDRDRFPDDIRDPVIVTQCEAEEARLTEVEQLVADRIGDLEAQERIVEESRRRYDEHIRALVRRLRDNFSDICTTAGIDGRIELVPGDMQEELGIDVLVSHKIGETPVSYQEGIHSGGQATKIAIMLLLAAMSLGQAADLLIVDEHNAHLDGTNTGQIAQLMRRLSSRVQFILSAPTDGKGAAVAGSCDIQVTFLPRDPGHTLSPPVRLMTRLDAPSLDARFESLQQSLT
ncbi:ATP-binding protein [Nonomuraea sp. CA-141351]|uniref:ATP-binding protein n=1 Tax=Nonomuraea sp. CA-141351 TaxID=3239996 RepID=UPI003D8D65D8